MKESHMVQLFIRSVRLMETEKRWAMPLRMLVEQFKMAVESSPSMQLLALSQLLTQVVMVDHCLSQPLLFIH